ncbi:hypothetical protein [Microbacterium sp. 2FI]|uniref:hypothetical protein n=1 Tax=Microbacterium sp. 2FI TaxID=2502193 RepID=UPI0010F5C195|nr:hypothetical protein [Microbacterium sp. 2FI]
MEKRQAWHPLLAAVEGPTGTWRLVDTLGMEYGSVEIRRVMNGTEVRYRASWGGEVLGWASTLREACERVHAAYLQAHGPGGAPVADWGESTGNARQDTTKRPASTR